MPTVAPDTATAAVGVGVGVAAAVTNSSTTLRTIKAVERGAPQDAVAVLEHML